MVRADPPRKHRTAPRPSWGREWLAVALLVLGVGLAINSLLGPFAADLVDYPLSETLLNQTIGLDAVTLLLVSPLSLLAGLLALRRHPLALFLGLALGSYTAYMFVQYVVGPAHLHYPGALPLQLGLFTLGWVVAARSWSLSSSVELPALTPRARRVHAVVLLALGGFVILRYLPAIPAALDGDPIPDESLQDPSMFWTIVLMDLGIFVPLALAAGVGLLRGAAWAGRVLYGAVGWFVLVTVAVAAMSLSMVANDDPNAAVAQLVLFAATALVVVTYAAWLYLPLATKGSLWRRSSSR